MPGYHKRVRLAFTGKSRDDLFNPSQPKGGGLATGLCHARLCGWQKVFVVSFICSFGWEHDSQSQIGASPSVDPGEEISSQDQIDPSSTPARPSVAVGTLFSPDDLQLAPAEPESNSPEVPSSTRDSSSGPATASEIEPAPSAPEVAAALREGPEVDTGAEAQVETNELTQKNKSVKIVYGFETSAVFDDNIFISSRDKQSDFYFTLAPSIAIGWGDIREEIIRRAANRLPSLAEDTNEERTFIFARYTPTETIFLHHSSQDDLDHDALLQGQWKAAYLTLGFRTAFQTLSSPEVDLGTRVKRAIFSQDIHAAYDYSDRTSFEVKFSGTNRDYEIGVNSTEYVNEDSINYRYGARTNLGLALRFGLLQVQDSPDQVYEQSLLRVRYVVTNKIALTANAGVEFRQIQGGGEDRANPVFGLGLAYRPYDQTFVSLGASRSTQNSASVVNQDIDVTSFQFTMKQRFFQRYYLMLYASYENAFYSETFSGGSPERTDNIVSIRPSIQMDITKTVALHVGYQYQRDASSGQNLSFTDNQIFVQLDVLF